MPEHRYSLSIRALNLLLPGGGPALARGEWSGLALALLFSAAAQLFVAGRWIAPQAVPGWLTASAGLVAAAAWLFGQLLMRRRRLRGSPHAAG